VLPVGFPSLLSHGLPLPLQFHQSLLVFRQPTPRLFDLAVGLGNSLNLGLLLAAQRAKFGQNLFTPGLQLERTFIRHGLLALQSGRLCAGVEERLIQPFQLRAVSA
jgi:hypothetical protein